MNIGKLIHDRRMSLGLTLEEVGNAVGVGKSTVKKWEDGYIANMRRDKISALSKILDINPVSLISGTIIESNSIESNLPDNIIPMPKMNKIPLIGTIACGTPITAVENVECEVDIPEHINADFALRCKGDSMIDARINDGDIVYIRQQPIVENGEIAVVLIENEATLKRFYREGNTVTLMPCNSKHKPFFYSGEQLNEIRILGKAVGFTSTDI